jgi:hypothetical protein
MKYSKGNRVLTNLGPAIIYQVMYEEPYIDHIDSDGNEYIDYTEKGYQVIGQNFSGFITENNIIGIYPAQFSLDEEVLWHGIDNEMNEVFIPFKPEKAKIIQVSANKNTVIYTIETLETLKSYVVKEHMISKLEK